MTCDRRPANLDVYQVRPIISGFFQTTWEILGKKLSVQKEPYQVLRFFFSSKLTFARSPVWCFGRAYYGVCGNIILSNLQHLPGFFAMPMDTTCQKRRVWIPEIFQYILQQQQQYTWYDNINNSENFYWYRGGLRSKLRTNKWSKCLYTQHHHNTALYWLLCTRLDTAAAVVG